MKIKIYSRYEQMPKVKAKTAGNTKVQQHFADEVNINTIMDRYKKTGYYYDPFVKATGEPLFGDFSDVKEYRESMDQIIDVQNNFEKLPAKVRRRFHESAIELFEFLSDPDNLDEAKMLGLVVMEQLPLDVTVPSDTESEKETEK